MRPAPAISPWPLLTAAAVLVACLGGVAFSQGLFVAAGSPLSPLLGTGSPWLALLGVLGLAAGIAGWMGEGRSESAQTSAPSPAATALARRNSAVLWSLVAFIVIVFVITLVRLDPDEFDRPPLTLHPATPPPSAANLGGAS
jgi:hypothetical protein